MFSAKPVRSTSDAHRKAGRARYLRGNDQGREYIKRSRDRAVVGKCADYAEIYTINLCSPLSPPARDQRHGVHRRRQAVRHSRSGGGENIRDIQGNEGAVSAIRELLTQVYSHLQALASNSGHGQRVPDRLRRPRPYTVGLEKRSGAGRTRAPAWERPPLRQYRPSAAPAEKKAVRHLRAGNVGEQLVTRLLSKRSGDRQATSCVPVSSPPQLEPPRAACRSSQRDTDTYRRHNRHHGHA